MIEIDKNECLDIYGGSFGLDAGWFLGHILNGDLAPLNFAGYAEATADYINLYM